MGNNDFSNIGDQIRDAVEDAIDSMDFRQLNQTISNTVSDAVDEVRRQFTGGGATHYRRRYEEQDRTENRQERRQEREIYRSSRTVRPPREESVPYQEAAPKQRRSQSQELKKITNKLRIHPPSRTKGILLTVFGGIGLGFSLAGLLALLIIALFSNTLLQTAWGLAVFLLALTGVFGFMIGRGNSIRGRVARLKLYLKEADNKTYCSIRELVGCTGKPEKFVIKDLKKMIRDGVLPHAHLDDKNTCLMLDDNTYNQYLQSMESLKLRTQETQQTSHTEDPPGSDDQMSKVTAEGHAYLKALRDANEAIPGEIISSKLDRLETIIEKIFDVIYKHPEQLVDLERFMEYYLPTTVKLVNAYRDFDSVGINGDNISMAKTEVEATLDTINQAFEQLLDGLYQDEAFDISTDASVLQTMLKKDGFVNSDFDRREES